jgi:hypothetical protein
MYALGRFLDIARNNLVSPEFLAIQRATGARNFLELLRSNEWAAFINQVFDNSLEGEGRCCDGVRQALEANLAGIIRAEQPQDIPTWFLWCEHQIDDYCERFLRMFNFHFGGGHEEGTYGGSNLRHKVNPIFGFSPVEQSQFFSDRYMEGREPVSDVLAPFKKGIFQEFSSNGFFYNRGYKKNVSNRRLGDYRFVHIAPFSPVAILYRSICNLFQKRFTGGEENSLSHEEQETFNVLLRLLLSISDIHHEYIAFIAPVLDTTVSGEQDALWNVDEDGIEPSLFAIKRNTTVNVVGSSEHTLFNQRLKFWKIQEDGNYFYPSFEACKHLAVVLGYAQWEKDGNPTDLAALELRNSFPTYNAREDRPGDRNPPAQAELYGIQFPDGQDIPDHFRGPFGYGQDQYYIDTRRTLRYANVNVWGEHIDGEDLTKEQQPPMPDGLRKYFTPDEIAQYADPIQKALYTAVYPEGQESMELRLAQAALERARIQQELAEAKADLRQWNELVEQQQQLGGGLSDADMTLFMTLTGKYNDKDILEGAIRDLRARLAEMEP